MHVAHTCAISATNYFLSVTTMFIAKLSEIGSASADL